MAAFAAAAVSVAFLIVHQRLALEGRPKNESELLLAFDERPSAFVASSALNAVSVLLLAVAVWYLFHATRYRRAELPPWTVKTLYVGALLVALSVVPSQLDQIDIGHEFASSGPQTNARAEDLLEGRNAALATIGFPGSMALALSIALVSLNAMRAGLLGRVIGILGVVIGILYVVPILGGPFALQIIWLGALGLLFWSAWPGGRGPAWETGEAAEWSRDAPKTL